MEITNKTRRQLRLQGWIFIVLFLAIIGLLAWLSTRYDTNLDWTATGRNSLSKASIAVLDKLKGPVTITSYASGGELGPVRSRVRTLVERYEKYSSKVSLKFVNPMTNPDQTRKLGIRTDGEMVVDYHGRSMHVRQFTEEDLTNTLQRLLRNAERRIVLITGHGERNPQGRANFDLGDFFTAVQDKGFKVSTLNLTQSLSIPANTSVLVIASPQVNYLPGEIQAIEDYVKHGGNLWWMQEPNSKASLAPLAKQLHIKFMDGMIMSAVRIYGENSPTAIVANYLPHAITNNFEYRTLFPEATGIDFSKKDDWNVTPFLQSMPNVVSQGRNIVASWLRPGEQDGNPNFENGIDIKGPINFGLALTRTLHNGDTGTKDKSDKKDSPAIHQRVVVMGDGDFISNTYVGVLGNQQLGENILNWLSNDDNFINIPEPTAPGSHLAVNPNTMITLGVLYLVIIPLILIVAGVIIWLRRRKR